jgi:hypothetical protein
MDWLPSVANNWNLGSSAEYWANVFAWEVNYNTIDAYPWDDEDDLALVRAIKPKLNEDGSLWRNKAGKPAYDVKTIPRALTNLDDLPAIMTEKYDIGGVGITSQDIEELMDEKKTIILPDGPVIDREEVSKHIFTKAARMSAFQLSVHRRLVAEIDVMRVEIETLKAARLN